MTVEYKFSNGDRVKEKVTGFTGTITGAVSYITGCNQYLVTAESKDERSEAKAIWYDEGRLTLMDVNTVKIEDVSVEDNGSDIQAPVKG